MKHVLQGLTALMILATMTGCNSGGGGAAAPATGGAATAPVAANGVAGPWRGTLDKAGTPVANHEVVVMTDGTGAPQIGFWEFCNVQMTGEGSSFTAAAGSSCLVDLGTGSPTPNNITSGSATFGDNSISATITFENGTVWTYTGTR